MLLRRLKDYLHQYLQKLVPVDYQVQNPVPVVPLHMFTIKSVYQEHLLKVKVKQVSTRYIILIELKFNDMYHIDVIIYICIDHTSSDSNVNLQTLADVALRGIPF